MSASMRQAFHTWAEGSGYDVTRERGIYTTLETRAAWETWQHLYKYPATEDTAQLGDIDGLRDALVWAEDAADCSSHPHHKAHRNAITELLTHIDKDKA